MKNAQQKIQPNKSKGLITSIKSWFSSTPEKIYIDPSTHHTPSQQDGWFFEHVNGSYEYFRYQGLGSATDAYCRCPPVAAIVNRKAQAFNNGDVWCLDEKEKVATTKEAEKMNNLLNNPNPYQHRRDFEAQAYIYMQLYGFSLALVIKPVGFTDPLDATSMWNICPGWIDFDATIERFNASGGVGLVEIVIKFNNVYTVLQVVDLLMIRDNVPSFQTLTFPGSKLHPLTLAINNIIGAYESRNVLINYRGALGILSADGGNSQYNPLPVRGPEKEELKQDFRRYGLKNRQFQVIITTANLKWQSMGYPTKDLMLMEEVQESTKEICSGLNFPPFILGLADTTFNNMNEAKKSLYQDSIIPDGCSFYDQMTEFFKLRDHGLHLDKDFSKISVLQEDKKFAADTRKINNDARQIEWNNGLITLDEWRVSNGDDPLPDGKGAIRSTDTTNSEVPLASIIGVGGVQGVIAILTAPGLSQESRQATLEILFGLSPEDAERMSATASPEEIAKAFALIQYREPNGQYSGRTGRWNAFSPGGQINFNENGNH